MSVGRIFEGDDQPLVTTNFMRHLHEDLDDLPSESHRSGSFNRYRTLLSRFEEHGGPVDLDFIKESNACVAATGTAPPRPYAAGRTLWHALYFPEERRMDVSFYLVE